MYVHAMQGSARSALTKACVPSESLPHALAFNTLTSYVGEFSAPGLFYLTVALGGKGVTLTLTLTPPTPHTHTHTHTHRWS